jgi:hypothetical protein
MNKVFEKRSSRLLARFSKFFIMAHLPLCRTCAEGRRLQHELRQSDRCLHPIVVKEPQVTYDFSFQIMFYILNILIYIGMILLDNLLQCLLFITMINLSITYGSTASLIYNALLMVMIYFGIKIKIKVLIFSTIQKSYCRHFSFMAGFVDALKHVPFTDVNLKRWQMRVTLWLTAINVFWVSEGKSEWELTPEKEKAYSKANTIFCGAVVEVLAETL